MSAKIFLLFFLTLFVNELYLVNISFAQSSESEVKGDEFSPTALPMVTIQGFWQHGISGSASGRVVDPADYTIEEGSQFFLQHLIVGVKGKVYPTVSYFIKLDLIGTGIEGQTDNDFNLAEYISYSWIDIGIIDKYLSLKLVLFDAPKTREGMSDRTLLFTEKSSVLNEDNTVMGLMLYGSALDNKLHYFLWGGNATGSQANLGLLFSEGFAERYLLGFRLQYDFLRKWNHGNEWLQTRDMNASLGISVNFVPVTEDYDPAIQFVNQELLLHIDFGFTVSVFYIQSGLSLVFAKAAAIALNQIYSPHVFAEDLDHQMYMGGFVDIAFTATSWLVPAVRFEYRNAKLGEDNSSGITTIVALPDEELNKEELMNFLVVLNLYPFAPSHRFKIQPEFIYRIKETDKYGNQVMGRDGNEYNAMAFRIGLTLNL